MSDQDFKYWAFISYSHADEEWAIVRPPLTPLAATKQSSLRRELAELGFSISENEKAVLRISAQMR